MKKYMKEKKLRPSEPLEGMRKERMSRMRPTDDIKDSTQLSFESFFYVRVTVRRNKFFL